MYTVEKTFEFDLAHRIHNQNLDGDFTEGKPVLKCRRLHGHTAQLKVKLGSDKLVDDMVLDYNEIGFVKNMINDILDHRTLLSITDPLFNKVVKKIHDEYSQFEFSTIDTGWNSLKINISHISDQDIKEFLDAFILVPFTTSSENISKWISDIVSKKIELYNSKNGTNVKVVSVSYKETPKSEAVYSM